MSDEYDKTGLLDAQAEAERQNAAERENMRGRHPPTSIVEVQLDSLYPGSLLDVPIASNGETIGELILDGSQGNILVLSSVKIWGPVENQGFGSQVMRALLSIARSRGFSRLVGEMRYEDRQKLRHFYGKFRAKFDGLDFIIEL